MENKDEFIKGGYQPKDTGEPKNPPSGGSNVSKPQLKTIHIAKEDIQNELHPNLWYDWLDKLDLPEDTEMIVVEYKYHE